MPAGQNEPRMSVGAAAGSKSDHCIHEGTVHKQSRKGRWNARYFRLEEHYLKYYKTKKSASASCVTLNTPVHCSAWN